MADLRRFVEDLGFGRVQTLLQSGNVVFDGGRRSGEVLERLLEDASAERLGLRTDYLVRDSAGLQAIVDLNPYPREAERDPGHLVVVFMKTPPSPRDVHALQASISGPEVVRAAGRELYAVYPSGIGRSKLTTQLIESKLRSRGTGRNWNTVLKLRQLVKG
jgi:uncharacterized protein (DUF1697 family)